MKKLGRGKENQSSLKRKKTSGSRSASKRRKVHKASPLTEVLEESGNRPEEEEEEEPKTPKPKNGLNNLGNTCWLNALLQCFFAVPGFPEYIASLQRQKQSRRSGPDLNTPEMIANAKEIQARDEFIRNLQTTFNALKLTYRRSPRLKLPQSFSPIGLWKSLKRPSDQHDTHEKLMWFLDQLEKSEMQSLKATDQSDETEEKVDPSQKPSLKINEFFQGVQTSTLSCSLCGFESVSREPFQALSLALKKTVRGSGKMIELEKQLKSYFKPETLKVDWKCSNCKKISEPTKRLALEKAPKNLIIHLKRFEMDWEKEVINKIGNKVSFPTTGLNLRTIDKKRQTYDLIGVVNHFGTMEAGHYVASTKDLEKDAWFTFDDEEAKRVRPSSIIRKTAYILYFVLRD